MNKKQKKFKKVIKKRKNKIHRKNKEITSLYQTVAKVRKLQKERQLKKNVK